jgi:hypothetical protein
MIDESTGCQSCGRTTQLGQSELDPGRKTGAAALRSLGMLILVGSITLGLGSSLIFGSAFPNVFLILACAVGGGMHYAGRKMNPHEHSASVAGAVGGVLGGTAIVVGMLVALLVVAIEFFESVFG